TGPKAIRSARSSRPWTPTSLPGSPRRRSAHEHAARRSVLLPVLRRTGHPAGRGRRVDLRIVRADVRSPAPTDRRCPVMAEREPVHEPTLPLFVEETAWVEEAAERFEHTG